MIPYSPPCISFSGNNGGATSAGVSANAINVSYRITSDSESFQQTLASLGGANITDTTADIERTVNALATYFDNHFQFYGRKLNIEFFNGQGSITNELLGSGQQQADADAVTAAQTEHAFAELNGVTEPYDVALGGPARDLVRGALPVGVLHGPVRPLHVEPRHRVQRRGGGHQRALPEVARRRERHLRRRQPAGQAAQGGDHRPERSLVPVGGAVGRRRRRRRPATRSPTTSSTS